MAQPLATVVPGVEYRPEQVEGSLLPSQLAGTEWDRWVAEVGRRVVEDVMRNPRKYASTPGGRSIARRVLAEWENIGMDQPPTWVLEMLPGPNVALTPSAASYYRDLLASAAGYFEPNQYAGLLTRVPSYIYNPAAAGSIPAALEALQVQSALRGGAGLVYDPYAGTYRLSRGAQEFGVRQLSSLLSEGVTPPISGAEEGQAATQAGPTISDRSRAIMQTEILRRAESAFRQPIRPSSGPVAAPQPAEQGQTLTQRIMNALGGFFGRIAAGFDRARALTQAFAMMAPNFVSREQFIAWVQANQDELARRYGEDAPRTWLTLARDPRSTTLFGRSQQ